jgi:hypothetical protein
LIYKEDELGIKDAGGGKADLCHHAAVMLTLAEFALSQSQTPICARSIVTAVSILVDRHHADAAILKSLSSLECIQASEQ